MKVKMRMPTKKQYNLVPNDDLDIRVPLHTEEAFTHGIKFNTKYIGTLDVPRPSTRMEIVAAMRRIRYEFKARNVKKKKITIEVSVDGVKVALRKKKKQAALDDTQLLIMSHPVYRIFYVSHDSQDLKIFSYIARDAASNVFKCHVFKANKKMLKNRTGDPIVSEDKPRKKLSFRDPEVVSSPRNGPHSAPSVLIKGSPSLPRHAMLRPHSISSLSGSHSHVAVTPFTQKLAVSRSASPVYSPKAKGPQSPVVARSMKGHHRHGSWDGKSSEKTKSANKTKTNELQCNDIPKQKVKSPSRTPSDRSLEKAVLDNSMSMEDLDLENQAMRVVRTVGQAFEVCHKLSSCEKSPEAPSDEVSQGYSELSSDKPKRDEGDSESGQEELLGLTSNMYNEETETPPRRPSTLEPLSPPPGSDIIMKTGETFSSPLSDPLPMGEAAPSGTPLSVHHEMQLLREQLEQQQQQTQTALAQVHLLRDQLAAETGARLEAQARAHQLLVHNKELLEHIQQLVLQIREFESRQPSSPKTTQHSPSTPDLSSQLPTMDTPGSWMNHLQRLNHQVTVHSLLSIPDTPPTPSAKTFLFPQSPSRPPVSPMIFPLPYKEPRSQGVKPKKPDHSSTISLASDDIRKESNPSSVESVTTSYSDPWRLPQVPEDSVPLPPYGPIPLGTDRGGSITRAASERYARQETLAHLQRMAWARHTTK